MKSLINGFSGGFGRVFGRIVAYIVIGFIIYFVITTFNIDFPKLSIPFIRGVYYG